MITIHRVVFKVDDKIPLAIPGFRRPLHIEKANGLSGHLWAEMWYEVDTSITKVSGENVCIFPEGTGHPVQQSALIEYVNTVIWELDVSRLVFHFYVGWER